MTDSIEGICGKLVGSQTGRGKTWNQEPPSLSGKNLTFSLETSWRTERAVNEIRGFWANIN